MALNPVDYNWQQGGKTDDVEDVKQQPVIDEAIDQRSLCES